jgi:hypothetical protein
LTGAPDSKSRSSRPCASVWLSWASANVQQ